jgi:hypothetical protein
MKITDRRPHELMEFTAVGRAVRGAAGNVRTVNTVTLSDHDGGGTRVNLASEMAMGGVLGSVGQKVIAKQAGAITKQFAAKLERAINGEAEPVAASAPNAGATGGAPSGPAAVPAAPNASGTAIEPAGAGGALADPRVKAGLAAVALALLAIVLRRARR